MAKPNASIEQMWDVLYKVKIDEFVKSQEGLNTMISEGGKNFSGGQKQRLLLARALLKDAPIYLLDEATSNIDVESENQIMKILYELSKTKLVICISHRLENVIKADRIYCLEDGKIVESGTHEELIENGLVYANLYKTQKELESYGV